MGANQSLEKSKRVAPVQQKRKAPEEAEPAKKEKIIRTFEVQEEEEEEKSNESYMKKIKEDFEMREQQVKDSRLDHQQSLEYLDQRREECEGALEEKKKEEEKETKEDPKEEEKVAEQVEPPKPVEINEINGNIEEKVENGDAEPPKPAEKLAQETEKSQSELEEHV